jgi:4-hydroxy-tetrahydrodipicolinate synthase
MPTVTPSAPYGPLVTAMVTPFTSDGKVDYARAEALTARLLENGSTGLVVTGTTGESPTLTPRRKA